MKMRRSFVLGASVVALAASIGVAGPARAAGTPVVENDRQVTASPDPARLFLSPAIAISPSDPNTLAIFVGDARNGGCGLYVSHDGGLSWVQTTQTVMPADKPFCVQRNFGPAYSLHFASNGTLYVGVDGSAPQDTPNGGIAGLLAKTTDLGLTHQTYVSASIQPYMNTLANGTPNNGLEQWREPSLAVDPNNPQKLYAGWRLWMTSPVFQGLPQRAYLSTSNDGGITWSTPADVLRNAIDDATAAKLNIAFSGNNNLTTDVPMMVVGADGTAYAFIKEGAPRAAAGQPANKNRIFMMKSTDGGKTWKFSVASPGFTSLGIPDPVIAPNGDIYLVFDSRGNSSTAASNAFFIKSTDKGATWSSPVNLIDTKVQSSSNQYMPGISVAPDGRIDVAWFDFRDDPFYTPGPTTGMGSSANQRYGDVYYTYSNDGGKTWAPNMRLTDRSSDYKIGATFANSDIRGPMGVASANYAAFVTWPDSRASSAVGDAEDAYMTRVRFSSAPGATAKGTASAGTKALWAILGAAIALVLVGLLLNIVARRRRETPTPAPAA
jgi:hypothetical protein